MATPAAMSTLAKGENLFREGDVASSLFILKKGQLRLYKDKGDGIVDLAILRAGEVLGEMSYFDKDSTRRNCSASAMTDLEFVEISFEKFSKVIENLNPWFKTIISTLVERLNKSNARIKSLEAISAIDYSDSKNSLTSLKPIDLAKVLSTIFLSFKAHAEVVGQKQSLKKRTLNLYARDVFNISEAKIEQIVTALTDLGLLSVVESADDDILVTNQLDQIKSLFVSFNSERHLNQDKIIKVSNRCFLFLDKIWEKIKTQSASGDDEFVSLDITSVIKDLRESDSKVQIEDLADAKMQGFVKSVLVDEDIYSLPVNYAKLKKYIYFLRVKNYFFK